MQSGLLQIKSFTSRCAQAINIYIYWENLQNKTVDLLANAIMLRCQSRFPKRGWEYSKAGAECCLSTCVFRENLHPLDAGAAVAQVWGSGERSRAGSSLPQHLVSPSQGRSSLADPVNLCQLPHRQPWLPPLLSGVGSHGPQAGWFLSSVPPDHDLSHRKALNSDPVHDRNMNIPLQTLN